MKEGLKAVLKHLVNFSDRELAEITSCFKVIAAKKNTILLAHGATCRKFYYVHKGCIRTYYLTPEGDEKTRYIMPEQYIGTALTSFISQKPSSEIVSAAEDSELMAIGRDDFYRLMKEIPAWSQFYQTILEMAYIFQGGRIASMITLSAKQRYRELLHENAVLIQRLPDKILASYLDIRPETLSRLKRS